MPKFCIDTSGLSHPHENIPEDIHASLWDAVRAMLANGDGAVTKEIFDEICLIDGGLGEYVTGQKSKVLFEVGAGQWDWETYIAHNVRMQDDHKQWISEYTTKSPKTICLNDITIIALGKTLGLPVLSMEALVPEDVGSKKRRIPNICKAEGVAHVTFNDFCRTQNYKF